MDYRKNISSNGKTTYFTAQNTRTIMKEQSWKSAIAIFEYFHIPRNPLVLNRFEIESVYSAYADFLSLRDIYSNSPRSITEVIKSKAIGDVAYLEIYYTKQQYKFIN